MPNVGLIVISMVLYICYDIFVCCDDNIVFNCYPSIFQMCYSVQLQMTSVAYWIEGCPRMQKTWFKSSLGYGNSLGGGTGTLCLNISHALEELLDYHK